MKTITINAPEWTATYEVPAATAQETIDAAALAAMSLPSCPASVVEFLALGAEA